MIFAIVWVAILYVLFVVICNDGARFKAYRRGHHWDEQAWQDKRFNRNS